MELWRQFNTSPWVTLERLNIGWPHTIHFEMQHSKTLARQTIHLEENNIYRLDDTWTQKYVLEQLGSALAVLTRNTAEAGVSSFDVYREDYPA
jgi:hypothetical protein